MTACGRRSGVSAIQIVVPITAPQSSADLRGYPTGRFASGCAISGAQSLDGASASAMSRPALALHTSATASDCHAGTAQSSGRRDILNATAPTQTGTPASAQISGGQSTRARNATVSSATQPGRHVRVHRARNARAERILR